MRDPASYRKNMKRVERAGTGCVGFFVFCFVLLAVLAFTSPAFAADRTWSATSGDWSTAANWGGTEPTSADDAHINNGGGATISAAGEAALNLYLGDGSGNGVVTLSGTSGTLAIGSGLYVGLNNTGAFNQSAGTSTIGTLYLSGNSGSSGTVQLIGGTMNLTNLSVGSGTTRNFFMSGTGILNYSGATWDFTNGTFSAGTGSGSLVDFKGAGAQSLISGNQSFYNLTHSGAGTLTLNTNNLTVGGAFTNSGGTFDANGYTVTFNGAGTQNLNSGGSSFSNISHTGAGALTLLTNPLTTTGTFTNSGGNYAAGTLASTFGGLYTLSGGAYSGSGTQTFNGGLTISGGTYSGTGLLDTTNLTLSSGTLTAPATFNVSGDWSRTGGTFTPGTGIVTFDKASTTGTGIQTLNSGGSSFYRISHTGTGTLQLTNNLAATYTFANSAGIFDANGYTNTVTSSTTLSGTSEYRAGSALQSFNGGLTISGGTLTGSTGGINAAAVTLSTGTLTAPTGAFNVSGNWSKTGGTFTPGTGTVTFDKASSVQTLNSGGSSFNKISHTGAGTLRLSTSALTTTGTFTNSAGSFDAYGLAHTVTGLTTLLGGDYAAGGGTQTFNGGLLINGGTFTGSTASGTTTTTNVTLQSGTLIAPLSSGVFNVSGDWSKTGGTFTPGTGVVTFNKASGTQTLDSGGSSFYSISHNAAGTLTLNTNSLTVTRNFTNSAGTFDASDFANSFGGTLGVTTLSGGSFLAGTGKQTFSGYDLLITGNAFTHENGTVALALGRNFNPGTSSFYNIENSGSVMLQTNPLTTLGTFTNLSGTFDAYGQANTVTGLTTLSGGAYTAGSALQTFNGGLLINGGTLSATSGGNIDTTNMTLSSGALTLLGTTSGTFSVSGDWSKTGGTFTPNSRTVTFDKASGEQTLDSGGSSFYSVSHTGAGALTLTNNLTATGAFTNSAGIFDAGGDWTNTVTGLTTLSGGEYKARGGLQSFNGGLTLSGGTLTGGTGNIDTTNVTLTSGTLTAPTGDFLVSGNWARTGATFTPGTGTVTFDLASAGIQTLNSGGASFANIVHSGTGTLRPFTSALNITGDLTNSAGTFGVAFYDMAVTVGGLATISGGDYAASGVATSTFGNLLINGGTLTGSTGIINTGDMTLSSGTLTAPSGAFNVSGNWDKSGGTFTPGTNTVTFNKSSGTQTLDSGGSSFYNVTHSGGGTLQLDTNNLTATGFLANNNGILSANGRNISVTGAFTNDGTLQVQGGETLTFTKDTNSGTVEYVGDGGSTTYTSLNYGKNYYNLSLDAGNNTYAPTQEFIAGNNLTLKSGTLTNPDKNSTVSGNLVMGNGTFNLDAGTLAVTGDVVETTGTLGTLNVDGGAITVTGGDIAVDNFNVGYKTGMTGTFTLASGKTLSATNESVGYAGTGTFVLSGGTNTITGALTIGDGSYTLSSGALTTGSIANGTGAGIFTYGGGTLSFTTANIDTFNVNDNLTLPGDVSAGTVTIASGKTLTQTNENLSVTGDINVTKTGTLAYGGGTLQFTDAYLDTLIVNSSLTLPGDVTANDLTVSNSAALTQGSGKTVTVSDDLTINAGTYNLNGGTLVVGSDIVNGTGAGVLNIGGGTLQLEGGAVDVDTLNFNSGTIQGTGTINTAFTVESGGILSAGNSNGVLNFSETVTIGSGGILEIEITDWTGDFGIDFDGYNFTGDAELVFEEGAIMRIVNTGSGAYPDNFNPNTINTIQPFTFVYGGVTNPDNVIFQLVNFGQDLAEKVLYSNGEIELGGGEVPELPVGALIPVLSLLGVGAWFIRRRATAKAKKLKPVPST